MRAATRIILDDHLSALGSGRRRREDDTNSTFSPRRDLAGVVGTSVDNPLQVKVGRGRPADLNRGTDIEHRASRVRQGCNQHAARRSRGLVFKRQSFRRQNRDRGGSGRAAREADALGTSGSVVGDRQRGGQTSDGPRSKYNLDRATRASRESQGRNRTVIGLPKFIAVLPAECERRNRQLAIAVIGKGYRLRCAVGPLNLSTEVNPVGGEQDDRLAGVSCRRKSE